MRLMDTSLAPQASLGRMLHTISSTAYECADNEYLNMLKYGIIEDSATNTTVEDTYVTNWREESIAANITSIEEYNAYIIQELEKDPNDRGGE